MTVFEMQGVLRGKAIPGDMKVNESLAEYLVRKLADAEARGVEKFADTIGAMYQHEKPSTVRARTIKHIVFLATHYAKDLREAR
ncbi:TPA: hypothetical protein ACSTLS_000730 [Serratia fonticola]